MPIIEGCHEGKHTPRLVEVKCPQCGEIVEVFVKMGGSSSETGRIVSDERCVCGYVFEAGTPLENLEEA